MSVPISRLGFHYFPDDSHYTERDLDGWLPVLLELSVRWLVLHANSERVVPEAFVRGLIEAGIKPVVWIKDRVDYTGVEQLSPALANYAEWGVREIVVYDRPNNRSSWSSSDWTPPGLVERFVDRMLPILQRERAVGLHPVFPPLQPGGDYWDTAFLETALKSMLRRGHRSLVEDMYLAIYAWTFGKPLEWGHGGPANWPESQPYSSPEGSQDQIGFRTFDWYSAASEAVVGKALPMIVVAGGNSTDEQLNGPAVEEIAAMLRALQGGDLPESVVGFNFHLLAADPSSPNISSAWFASPNEPKEVVRAARRVMKAAGSQKALQRAGKSLSHFVLLPDGPVSQDTWEAVKTLVQDGVVGFSPEEALQASRVTILGDEAAVPPSVERRLIQGGCEVARVKGPGQLILAAWKATYGVES